MRVLLQDLRYAFRMFAKSPGLTAIALITLALGVGVNTGLFSIVNGMRVIPDRFADADDLVFLYQSRVQEQQGAPVNPLDYLDWREQATTFKEMGLYSQRMQILVGSGEPERVRTIRASAELLPMFGFDAQVGRLYSAEEDSVGSERVVLLTDEFWKRRFDADEGVLGRTVTLNDEPHTIIGILSPGVDFEELVYRRADLVAPLRLDPAKLVCGSRWCTCVARLKEGTTIEQAEAEMRGISARLATAYPDTNKDLRVWVQSFRERLFSTEDKLASLALLAAVGSILLIACVNLANLLMAKATSRAKEFAARAALGAGRGRIIRQLLTETMLIALAGGGLGLVVGVWAIDLLVASQGGETPFREQEVGLNQPVMLYTLAISCAAALMFGCAPAFAASKVSLSEALKEGAAATSAGASRNRLRSTLVVGQLAITLPLIVCAGLVVRHLIALKTVNVGFNTERLLTVQLDLPTYRYENGASQVAFFQDGIEAMKATPGVSSVAAVSHVPLGGMNSSSTITIEGREGMDPSQRDYAGFRVITPDYFKTMEIPLINGRFFMAHDHEDADRVAIINWKMATRYWPDQDALGKRFKAETGYSEGLSRTVIGAASASGESAASDPWITVVGVVGDTGHAGLYSPPRPEMYFPLRQMPRPGMAILARTLGDPMQLTGALREVIRRLDPDQPVYGVRSMDDIIHRWLRDDRSAVWFLSGLALLALSLATVGLYGVMSYSVAQRTHEIGVRIALGAGKEDVQYLVLKRCLKLSAIGIAVGLLISAAVGLVLQSQLFGVSGIDPITFTAVPILLLLVAGAAGYLPARRATKVDPMVALRHE
ncbi:MAG: ABC transporter permease [Phycisphaerae bacterium]